jgi:hypothetical protein
LLQRALPLTSFDPEDVRNLATRMHAAEEAADAATAQLVAARRNRVRSDVVAMLVGAVTVVLAGITMNNHGK